MEDSDDEIIAAKPKKAAPAKKPAAAAAMKPSPAAGKPKPSRDVAFADGGLGELGWRSGLRLLLLLPAGIGCEEAAVQRLERCRIQQWRAVLLAHQPLQTPHPQPLGLQRAATARMTCRC